MNIKKILAFTLGLGLLAIVAAPVLTPHVFAYDPTINGINNTNIPTPGTNTSATSVVLNIIKVALGVLSLVAVVFIMFGGFRWLTAGGNEENLKKAKDIISAAVIGLVIVLLAYIIVIFVARFATSAANGNINGI